MLQNIIYSSIIYVFDLVENIIDLLPFADKLINISNYINTIINISNYMQHDILPILYYFVPFQYFAPIIIVFSVLLAFRIFSALINLMYP